MAEPMVIEVDGEAKAILKASDQRKPLKRKRGGGSPVDPLLNLTSEEKSAKIDGLRDELKSLFKLYKELMGNKVNENAEEFWNASNKSNFNMDSTIAVLMEESELPLSKLVCEIFEKLKAKIGHSGGISSVASVKSKVLLIGQRTYNGILDEDADLLEDGSESALWCWETKDLKVLPKSIRDVLKIRRTCRKKIHERITAVSGILTALENLESDENCHQELVKASARLPKTMSEADIRFLVDNVAHKTDDEVAGKGAKQEEKLLVKQLEKNRREEEKERRRMERELQKEKLQNEKELKRLQDEAEKEQRRREKEEADMKKLLKRHQEEAEKDQRRKEKEEAELKKQLLLQKQASLMERFLNRGKRNSADQIFRSSGNAESDSSPKRSKEMRMPVSVTLTMDSILLTNNGIKAEDIWKLHLNSWHSLGHSIRSNRNMCWGIRQKPKTELVKELKLTANRGLAHDDEMSIEKFEDGWVDFNVDSRLCQTRTDSAVPTIQKHVRSKQLLQFDKSNRPAFYGIWPRKSQVVGARHPFAKDPELDYDIDSDEEWEEEEPGESLSDCDKDDEDESLEEGCSKGNVEDESEDGFFVPDGYLSENEGVEVDKVNSDHLVEETGSSPTSKESLQSDDFQLLLRQQKCLQKLTEQALRKNQPLIILNFKHEKTPLLFSDNLSGTEKLEKMCLQALSICAVPVGPSLEISISNDAEEEDQQACTSNGKANNTTLPSATAILETDLPQIVSVIQSCSCGINKLVESLQEKFPSVSKSQLRNKVREISDFVDNHWQVKKDILMKLGLTISPEKGSGRAKSIATFFSKRCLPPSGKSTNPAETSPQSSKKSLSSTPLQQDSAL